MDNYLFVSYSRRQYYFMEVLAKRLQDRDIPLWIDVTRLEPGLSWEQSIQRGLERCSGLLLIASRDALASPHVQKEWQTALNQHKPIYVVVFEPVELPAALQAAATILVRRGNMDALAKRLAQSTQTGHTYRDAVPQLNRLGLPPHLPRDIWLVTMALFTPGAALMMLVIGWQISDLANHVSHSNTSVTIDVIMGPVAVILSYAMIAVLFFYQARLFLKRRVNYYHMRFPLPFAPFVLLLPFFFWLGWSWLEGDLLTPESGESGIMTVRTILLLMIISIGILDYIVFLFVTTGSEAVYWWLPTGEAPDSLRSRYRLVPNRAERVTGSQRSVKYRLHFVPADQPVAEQVQQVFKAYPYLEPANESVTRPDVDLLILSGQTPYRLIGNILPKAVRPISLVASRVHVPEDFIQLLGNQWVDFRRRSRAQLDALAQHLSQPGAGTLPAELTALPETLDKWVAPPRITVFANLNRILFFVAIMINVLFLPFIIRTGTWQWQQVFSFALEALTMTIQIGVTLAVIDRLISRKLFLSTQIIYVALNVGSILLFMPSIPMKLGSLIPSSLVYAAYYRYFYRAVRDWLPMSTNRSSNKTLKASRFIKGGLRDSVNLVLIALLLLWPLILAAATLPFEFGTLSNQIPVSGTTPAAIRPVAELTTQTENWLFMLTPAPTMTSKSGWVRYNRSKDGFSIELPSGWVEIVLDQAQLSRTMDTIKKQDLRAAQVYYYNANANIGAQSKFLAFLPDAGYKFRYGVLVEEGPLALSLDSQVTLDLKEEAKQLGYKLITRQKVQLAQREARKIRFSNVEREVIKYLIKKDEYTYALTFVMPRMLDPSVHYIDFFDGVADKVAQRFSITR